MSSGQAFVRLSRSILQPTPQKARRAFPSRRSFGTTPVHHEPRSLPRIANPSIWTSMVPKFLKERGWASAQDGKPKGRNPATYFVVMFIFIGSQAIRTLTLRNEFDNYVRSTDAKIKVLRRVIDGLNRGEEVDVKGLLGTGNPKDEEEWRKVVDDIIKDDEEWRQKRTWKRNKSGTQAQNREPQEQPAPENNGSSQAPARSGQEAKSRSNFF